jgi:hypothetical protein
VAHCGDDAFGDEFNFRASSRKEARRREGRRLPVCPPFRASWQMAARLVRHVSSDLSKIPYGGFSPVRLQTGRQRQPSPFRAYMPPKLLQLSHAVALAGNRSTESALRRVSSKHTDPEALGSAAGCSVPSPQTLTMASSELLARSHRLICSPIGLCLAATGQQVPAFVCESF